MASNHNLKKVNTAEVLPPATIPNDVTQTFLAQMSTGTAYKPTERQIDKILELEEKKINNFHEFQTKIPSRYKLDTVIYFLSLFIAILFFIFIIQTKPEYTSQVVSLVVGLIGGGSVGYAKGKESKP